MKGNSEDSRTLKIFRRERSKGFKAPKKAFLSGKMGMVLEEEGVNEVLN